MVTACATVPQHAKQPMPYALTLTTVPEVGPLCLSGLLTFVAKTTRPLTIICQNVD